jgi:ribosomal-protein-alanine N-acetyltransferase
MAHASNLPAAQSAVRVRALEPDDWKETLAWRRDDATWDAVGSMKRFISAETERRWVLQAIADHEAGRILRFGITLGDSTALVGLYTAHSIDAVNRSCRVGVMLSPVGARGRGVASAARLLVYRYLFGELGLNRISGFILTSNTASAAFARRQGAVLEGVLRQSVFKDGRYQDQYIYSVLRAEFYARHGHPDASIPLSGRST